MSTEHDIELAVEMLTPDPVYVSEYVNNPVALKDVVTWIYSRQYEITPRQTRPLSGMEAQIAAMDPEHRLALAKRTAAACMRMARVAGRTPPQEVVEMAELYWQEFPQERPVGF